MPSLCREESKEASKAEWISISQRLDVSTLEDTLNDDCRNEQEPKIDSDVPYDWAVSSEVMPICLADSKMLMHSFLFKVFSLLKNP